MFIAGCGYLGRKIANRLALSPPPWGMVRSQESARQLAGLDIKPVLADLDSAVRTALPTENEQVFYLAPPPSSGQTDQRMQHFLEALDISGHPQRIVYISTTGVYGDCQGNWVDENQPAAPVADRARRRLDAEQQLIRWQRAGNGELVILRVAGIYGPGRLPRERLRKGLPMVEEKAAPWTNRIHVDDLVSVCLAAMSNGLNGEIYNVSDGHPGNMTDYFNRVADLLKLPRPTLITAAKARDQLSPGLLSYLRESRRIDNRKMLQQLAVSLRYPTLAEGLPACLDN